MRKVVIDSSWFFGRQWGKIKEEIIATIGDEYISDTIIIDECGINITSLIHDMLKYELERGDKDIE